MIINRKISVQAATALLAAVVLLLSFASAAQANGADRISVLPGFNGPVNAVSEPNSNGIRYLGGNFTTFQPWRTGNGALVAASSGDVNPTFPKVSGTILATASDGSGGFYIGGDFTCIGPNTSGNCTGVNDVVRNRAAHINANGSVNPAWNPNLNNVVRAIAVSGSTVYLGGWFTTVGGIARNYAAAVGTDGTLTSWNPDLNGPVLAIGVSGSNVYLGGYFTTVGGITRRNAAAVTTNGTITSWNPNLNDPVTAIEVSGSNVYLGGNFTTVGGIARNYAAAVGTDGTLSSWNPDLNGEVRAIAVSGSTVYLGGHFNTVGGITRGSAAAVTTDGTLTSWSPPRPGNSVHAIAVSGSTVYLGGNFTTVGGIARNYAVAVGTDGALTSWNPNPNSLVRAIAVSGSTVYLGGDFSTVGGITRNSAAAVTTNGTITSWNPNLSGSVHAIAVSGSNVYLGGDFTTAGGWRNNAAAVTTNGAITSWNPNLNNVVRAIAVSGSTVYLGGSFSTAGGITRNGAAAVGTDGNLAPWDPDLNNVVGAIAVSGSTVYLGGSFSTAGGITRNGAAAVGTDGNLAPWNPDLNGGVGAIAVSGSNIYLGGSFSTAGGITRNHAAAVTTNGNLTAWNPNLNNVVRAIAVSGSTVYLGGNFTNAGGTFLNYAAAVTTDGTLTPWSPNLNGIVNAIAVSESTVYLGGDFTSIGGNARNYSAAIGTDGALLDVLWPAQPMLLSVTKPGSGSGAVISSPAGIDCGADCSEILASGTRVILTAAPAAGSTFTSWSGGFGCSRSLTCIVIMSEARNITAEFTRIFDLTVGKSGSGSGTVTSSPAGIDCGSDCSETLVDGTSVTLTASPLAGSTFTGWNGDGCSGTSTCAVTMSEARNITAEFTRIFDLTVSKSGSGSGTITSSPAGINCGADCSESFLDETLVTLTSTPATGSALTGWNTGTGWNTSTGCSGTSTCTVTMNEARNITAEFTRIFDLTVSKSGSGSGTITSSPAGINCGPVCSYNFSLSISVMLTATPATGSTFTGWSGSGCSGSLTCIVTMSEARAVNAEFAVVPLGSFNLMVSKSGTGAGTVTSLLAGIDCGSDCSESLVDGTSVTLTASPAAGSSFTGWSGGCSGISTCTVTMNAARTVTAEFTMPPNIFPTPKVAKVSATTLISTVRVPGRGTLTQLVTRKSSGAVLTVCKASGKATKAGTVKLTCKLSSATRVALLKGSLKVSVKTTFTPTGGRPASKTQTVKLKRRR